MFQKRLLAFVCTGVVGTWLTVWTGDNLSQLSRPDFKYLVSFYGLDNLRFLSEFVSNSDDYSADWFEE